MSEEVCLDSRAPNPRRGIGYVLGEAGPEAHAGARLHRTVKPSRECTHRLRVGDAESMAAATDEQTLGMSEMGGKRKLPKLFAERFCIERNG